MIAPSRSASFSTVNIHFDSQERFCHFPINKNSKTEMRAQGLKPPRHEDEVQWFRRATPPVGSIPLSLCNIILPYDPHYTGPRGQHLTKDLVKLGVPRIGKAWVITTFVTWDDPLTLPIPDAYQVRTTFRLATKENVIVVSEVIDFDKEAFLKPLRLGSDVTVLNPEVTGIADLIGDPSLLVHFWNDPRKDPDNISRIWEIGDVSISVP
jgi:hypothetical protein